MEDATRKIEAEKPSKDAKAIALAILYGFEMVSIGLNHLPAELNAIREAIELHD